MSKRAYYIEYPDKEMAVMVKHGEDGVAITTSGDPWPEAYIASLMIDGYEVFAQTSTLHEVDGRDYRHWQPIDVADLPEVTLSVEGSDGNMYAQRRQLRKGRVVEAEDNPPKGVGFWGATDAHVEPVPLPKGMGLA